MMRWPAIAALLLLGSCASGAQGNTRPATAPASVETRAEGESSAGAAPAAPRERWSASSESQTPSAAPPSAPPPSGEDAAASRTTTSPLMRGPSLLDTYATSLVGEVIAFEFARAAITSQPTACPDLGRMRDRICDLAERICTLAEDLPPESPARLRCTDGRSRCERARRAVASDCGR